MSLEYAGIKETKVMAVPHFICSFETLKRRRHTVSGAQELELSSETKPAQITETEFLGFY
jgi:hypothetical protein